MPYIIREIRPNCFKLCLKSNPLSCFSKKCISKPQAQKQEKAIIISELKRYNRI